MRNRSDTRRSLRLLPLPLPATATSGAGGAGGGDGAITDTDTGTGAGTGTLAVWNSETKANLSARVLARPCRHGSAAGIVLCEKRTKVPPGRMDCDCLHDGQD